MNVNTAARLAEQLRAERDAALDAVALAYEAGRADALGIPPRVPRTDLPVRHLKAVR